MSSDKARLVEKRPFKALRMKFAGKQTDAPSALGISQPTLSRIERGEDMPTHTIISVCANLKQLAADKGENVDPFHEHFVKSPPTEYFGWAQLRSGARKVGRVIFEKWAADAVLTFPGFSSIFTSLVLAETFTPRDFLHKPVHTVFFVDKNSVTGERPQPGYSKLSLGRRSILVPKALDGNNSRMRRLAIIDDCILTGLTLSELRQHLVEQHGYTAQRIKGACCVLGPNPEIPPAKGDVSAYRAKSNSIEFPWGSGLSFYTHLATSPRAGQ